MRKEELTTDEYYHVFNRGVDKRNIFLDAEDVNKFKTQIEVFNCIKPTGSLFENQFKVKRDKFSLGARDALASRAPREYLLPPKEDALVDLIAYAINPNHFHLLLRQRVDQGISKYLQRICGGYVTYFNEKHMRSGTLFQGRYKAKHIGDNDYLLHVSAYVNLNNRLHRLNFGLLGVPDAKEETTSWSEYIDAVEGICEKDIILDQFKSKEEYRLFAEDSLELMLDVKKEQAEMKDLIELDV